MIQTCFQVIFFVSFSNIDMPYALNISSILYIPKHFMLLSEILIHSPVVGLARVSVLSTSR